MKVFRYGNNPIISPENIKPSQEGWEVVGVFNPGVTIFNDEILLLVRVAERPILDDDNIVLAPYIEAENGEIKYYEFSKNDPKVNFSDSRVIYVNDVMYLTSISHFRIARSKDGVNFYIDDKPTIFPEGKLEEYGIEDPRITLIDGVYYITYSAVSSQGICTCLIKTHDFVNFERLGAIFCPDNKDVVIFPEKINGKYYALHRPSSGSRKQNDIWMADSPDLISWGSHRFLIGVRNGKWDSGRVGGSLVPFKTDKGWLEIYHGATVDHRYCLGALLLDLNEPWKIIGRSENPIMEPETTYEKQGFFGNVIFSCGGLLENGILKLYYGASDMYVAYAELQVNDILSSLVKDGY